MELYIAGLKGGEDGTIPLKHINLVTGPNGSGKTRILTALRFVAQGFDPAIGKRPLDMAAVMSGDELDVRLTFDKRTIARGIKAGEDGYERSAQASWLKDAKYTEHSEAIRGLFGRDEVEAGENLDIRDLLALSPSKRAAKIVAMIGAEEEDPEAVLKEVWEWATLRLAKPGATEMPKHWDEDVWPLVGDPHKASLEIILPDYRAKMGDGGVTGTLGWAADAKVQERQAMRRKEAARKELAAAVLLLPETHPEEVARMERDRDGLNQEIGGFDERATAWDTREESATTARADLQAAMLRAGEFQGIVEDGLKLEQIKDHLDGMTAPDGQDYGEAQAKRTESRRLRAEADTIEDVEIPKTAAEEDGVRIHEDRLKRARDNPWLRVQGSVKSIRVGVNMTRMAKAGKEIFHDNLDAIDEIAKHEIGTLSIKEIEESITGAQATLEKAKVAAAEAQEEHGRRHDQRGDLVDGADASDAEAKKIEDRLASKAEAAEGEYAKARDDLIMQRNGLQDRVSEHAQVKAQADTAQATLAGLGQARAKPDPKDRERLEGKRGLAVKALKAIEAAAAKRDALETLVKEIADMKATGESYAALEWSLKAKRDRGVTIRGEGLKDTMERFLDAAARPESPYIRATQHKCEIGWRREGSEIPIEAMSGGEWALFAAALSGAVVAERNAAIRILPIEAGEADAEMLAAIMRGTKAIKDGLTMALVLTPNPPDAVGAAWNYIQTGEGVTA